MGFHCIDTFDLYFNFCWKLALETCRSSLKAAYSASILHAHLCRKEKMAMQLLVPADCYLLSYFYPSISKYISYTVTLISISYMLSSHEYHISVSTTHTHTHTHTQMLTSFVYFASILSLVMIPRKRSRFDPPPGPLRSELQNRSWFDQEDREFFYCLSTCDVTYVRKCTRSIYSYFTVLQVTGSWARAWEQG